MKKGEGRPDSLTLAAFFLFVLLGGANFVAVRFSNRALAPFWGAGLRFGLAALIFFVVLAARRLPLPRGRALVGAVLFGILNFAAAYALVYWGFLETPAGLGSVILALVPLLTLLLASLHGLEAFHWRGLVGALLAVVGIGVMFSQGLGGGVSPASILALVAGAACIAESGIVIKKFPRTDPITTNAVAMAVGSPLLLLLSLLFRERWTIPSKAETWITLAYVVLLGSVGLFILVIFVLKRWTASATSYSFVLFPIVATSLGALIGGEPIRAGVLIGGLIVSDSGGLLWSNLGALGGAAGLIGCAPSEVKRRYRGVEGGGESNISIRFPTGSSANVRRAPQRSRAVLIDTFELVNRSTTSS